MIKYMLWFVTVTFAALSCTAATLQAARFATRPTHVFVNQPFELLFEVEVSTGCDIQDIQISQIPIEALGLTLQPLSQLPKTTKTLNSKRLDVLRFSALAQASKAGENTFTARLHCTLLERSTGGFFSFTQSRSVTFDIAPFCLRILTLPEEGKPADFSGAIGTFTLQATLHPQVVQPGDILKLELTVQGDGNLNQASVSAPACEGFKVYPLKERVRETARLHTEQIFIPQTTNATTIGAVAFTYFNPATRHYEKLQAGPFPITFTHGDAAQTNDVVRIINTDSTATPETLTANTITLRAVNTDLRHGLPLLIIGGATLLACFCFFQLNRYHFRLAITLAIVIFLSGAVLAYRHWQKPHRASLTLTQRADVKFAPTHNSKVLFKLLSGTTVLPLESVNGWIRIDAQGKRGWVSAKQLDTPESREKKQP